MKNQESIGILANNFQTLMKDGVPKAPEEPKGLDLEKVDWETMDRGTLVSTIMEGVGGQVQKMLSEALAPLKETLGGLNTSTEMLSAKALIGELKGVHPDLLEWGSEIKGILERTNSSVTPEEAYQLARGSDTKKAVEMDEKYKPAGDKDAPEKGTIGLFSGSLPATVEDRDMTLEEAAEKSLADTFGDIGDDALAAVGGSSS